MGYQASALVPWSQESITVLFGQYFFWFSSNLVAKRPSRLILLYLRILAQIVVRMNVFACMLLLCFSFSMWLVRA